MAKRRMAKVVGSVPDNDLKKALLCMKEVLSENGKRMPIEHHMVGNMAIHFSKR
jgi:hypothetical protein